MGTPCDKWQWLHLIASERGPREATTRHVLHVLSLHMNQHGENAWPSQAHLAMRTDLSERAVRTHLAKARRAGWIEVYTKFPKGHGWKLNEYQATVPDDMELDTPTRPWEEDSQWQRAEPEPPRHRGGNGTAAPQREEPRSGRSSSDVTFPSSPVTSQRYLNSKRPANGAERAAPGSTTSGTSRPNVRNDVPTNSSLTLSINSTEEGALASKRTPQGKGLKKLGGESGLAKKQEELNEKLRKAVQQYPGIEDAKLAQMYQTDLQAVQAARRATR